MSLERGPAVGRFLARIHSPLGFCAAMVVFFAWLLAADQQVGLRGQLVLGAATWLVLVAACRPLPNGQRMLVGLVVVIASGFEVFASLIWGLYHYRLGNIPMFVPPGHGLVYLTGLKLSQAPVVRRHTRAFVGAVLLAASAWAVAGVTVLPRVDVVGAVGAVMFVAFLLRGRAPTVYGGVFLAVAALELYGTAIGTWTWVGTIPWVHLPAGNPPSGVAGGYVLFDVLAIALAPAAAAILGGLLYPDDGGCWTCGSAAAARPDRRRAMPIVVDEGVVRAYEWFPPSAERIRTVAYRWGGRRPARTEDDYLALDLLSGGVRQVVFVAERLGVDEHSDVVELGCGLGGPLRHMAHRYGCRITGVDITPAQLERARALSSGLDIEPRLDFVHADVRTLPFADATFSHAYSLEAWVHVSDKPAAIAEAFRVLRPGGRLVVLDFVLHDPHTKIALFHDAAHPLSLDRYVQGFDDAGFEDVKVTDYTAENREAYAIGRRIYGQGRLTLKEVTEGFETLQAGLKPHPWRLLAPGRIRHALRYTLDRETFALDLFGSPEVLQGVRQMCDDITGAYDAGTMSIHALSGRKP